MNHQALCLTEEQSAQLAPLLREGLVIVGNVHREQFNAARQNAETCGRVVFSFAAVPVTVGEKIRSILAGASVRRE